MLGRKREGSVVCPSCGNLVGVNDDECLGCGRRNPGLWGFAPLLAKFGRGRLDEAFPQFIIVVCVILFAATLVSNVQGIRMSGLMSFLSPSRLGLIMFGASGATTVYDFGWWWTILSASWLHGGLIHIFFNMYWVRMIGPNVIEFYGLSRMVIIYTLAGAAGFLLTSTVGHYMRFGLFFLQGAGDITIGASASILGLIGALVYYGRRSGSSMVGQQAKQWAIFLLLFGLFFPGVDNWAHLGGFAGGYLASAWLDPLKQERLDHSLGALACLVLTLVAIGLSVFNTLRALA
jgi:rhomboid protease GluP